MIFKVFGKIIIVRVDDSKYPNFLGSLRRGFLSERPSSGSRPRLIFLE